MKRTLGVFLGLGFVIGLGYLAITHESELEVTNDSMSDQTSIVEVKPTAAEMLEMATQELIDEAIAASSTEINAAVEAAAEAERSAWELKIEREVRAGLQADNDARLDAIDKETGAY